MRLFRLGLAISLAGLNVACHSSAAPPGEMTRTVETMAEGALDLPLTTDCTAGTCRTGVPLGDGSDLTHRTIGCDRPATTPVPATAARRNAPSGKRTASREQPTYDISGMMSLDEVAGPGGSPATPVSLNVGLPTADLAPPFYVLHFEKCVVDPIHGTGRFITQNLEIPISPTSGQTPALITHIDLLTPAPASPAP